jgi:hypothetical protein
MNAMTLLILIASFIVLASAHRLVMNSVDSYDGYGTGTPREWRQFEREKTGR